MLIFSLMTDPSPPPNPPQERAAASRLDPVALAWYRYRIESGHYDAAEVLQAIAEYLHQAQGVEDEPPPR